MADSSASSHVGETIAQRIIELQKKYDYTTTKLAQLAGYERSSFHRLVQDQKVSRQVQMLLRMCEAFGVSIGYFFPPEYSERNSLPLPEPLPKALPKAQPSSLPKKCHCTEARRGAKPVAVAILEAAQKRLPCERLAILSLLGDPNSLELIKRVHNLSPKGRAQLLEQLKTSQ